jgi:paraquat-inducible protein B
MIALLAFGQMSLFSKPQRFMVYIDESIQGLDVGSPVKLRGIRIGRVVDLNVRYEPENNHSMVAVTCELNRSMIVDTKGERLNVADPAELQKLVDRGLRAQLGILGLATGLLYVELDFVDPQDYPPPALGFATNSVVVPAMPSAISELQGNLTDILNEVKKIDFAGISTELKGLLSDTRKQMNGLDLKGALAQWQRTGASFEKLANSPEIPQVLANLNAAIGDLRQAIAHIDSQVGPTSQELAATLAQAKAAMESFTATANSAHRFIAAQSGLGDDTTRTMEQLRSAAEAVQRLADFIERNPQALISGKKR